MTTRMKPTLAYIVHIRDQGIAAWCFLISIHRVRLNHLYHIAMLDRIQCIAFFETGRFARAWVKTKDDFEAKGLSGDHRST